MPLTYDGDRRVEDKECDRCGAPFRLVCGFLLKYAAPYAVFFAACHAHDMIREAWIGWLR